MSPTIRRRIIFAACVSIGIAVYWKITLPQPRILDLHPMTKQIENGSADIALARVGLEIDTSGDQMGMGPKQSGLRLVVQYGNTLQYQLFASCNTAGFGGPDSGQSQFLVEADCDGKRIFVSYSDHTVFAKSLEEVLAQIQLPQEIQNIVWDSHLSSN